MERGLILSFVCIIVVFAALCILSLAYSLIGKIFTKKGGWAHGSFAPKGKVAHEQNAMASDGKDPEDKAPVEAPEDKGIHDQESYKITFGSQLYGYQSFGPTTTLRHASVHGIDPTVEADESVACVKSANAAGNGVVTSPLPGVILDVCVTAGQAVKAGDRVAVIEAMKMDNDITAEVSGTVKSVNVKKGDSVLEGAVIVTIG